MDIILTMMDIMSNSLTIATLILTCMGIFTWIYGFRKVWNRGFKNLWIQIKPIKKPICDYMIVDEGKNLDIDSVDIKDTTINHSVQKTELIVDPFSDTDSERIKVFISERPGRVLLLKTKRKKPHVERDNKFHLLEPIRINDIANKNEK